MSVDSDSLRYLVYLKCWTLTLRPLMVYSKVLILGAGSNDKRNLQNTTGMPGFGGVEHTLLIRASRTTHR